MKNSLTAWVVALLLTYSAPAQTPPLSAPPATPKHPVTDEYHGVKVTEDYRWLENWDDPAVKGWTAAQDARTREYLGHLPFYASLHARIAQMIGTPSVSYDSLQFSGGKLFALQHRPGQQQPLLVALSSPDDPASAKVIFDPNRLSDRGAFAIGLYVPSADAKYVAVVLSKDESEDGTAHVFDVASGEELMDVVPRAAYPTGGGSIVWKADDSGFYYTRYPQGNERPQQDINFYQQVYFHKLGTDPKQDAYIIGKEFPRIAETTLDSSDDGRWLLASVENGDGGEVAHFLMDANGHWTQLTRFDDAIVAVKFGSDDALYLLSRKNAPHGSILRLPLKRLDLAEAKVIVPQTTGLMASESDRASIEDFAFVSGRIYVVDTVGGPSRMRVFDGKGHVLAAPQLPPVSSVDQIVPMGSEILMWVQSYLDAPGWYRFNVASGKTVRTALFETSPIRFDDAEVVREFATSRDGTRIPLNIIRLRTTRLDGTNPVLLTAYGGYGLSRKPSFNGYIKGYGPRLWLDHGGVFVEANIRGGGEYGEEWHQAGSLTKKQNVFDDVVACAQYLIERKYTSATHLALVGESNGAVMAGAVITQHPDLFHAVVMDSGWYDMLRVELAPNGEFNSTEFGSVKDPEQFRALYAYSAYHHVKDGTPYPAVYLFSGGNDNRVDPMQSRKMTARLQAASSSGRPILLRFEANAGHGWGEALGEEISEDTDIFTFLFDQMGIEYAH